MSGVFPGMVRSIGERQWDDLKNDLVAAEKKMGIDFRKISNMKLLTHPSLDVFSLLIFERLRVASCKTLIFSPSDREFRNTATINLNGQDLNMPKGLKVAFDRFSIYNDFAVFGGNEKEACTWKIRWDKHDSTSMQDLLGVYREHNLFFSTGVSQCPAKRLGFNIFKLMLMNLVEKFDWVEVDRK